MLGLLHGPMGIGGGDAVGMGVGVGVGFGVGVGGTIAVETWVPCAFGGVCVGFGVGFFVGFGDGEGEGVRGGDGGGGGGGGPPLTAQMIVNVPASPRTVPTESRIETVYFGPIGLQSAAVAVVLEPFMGSMIFGPPGEPTLRNAIAAGFAARNGLVPTLMLVPTGPTHGEIETSFEVGPHSVE